MYRYIVHYIFNRSGSSWLWVTPWSLRKMLNWISDTYNKPRILITENGISDRNGSLTDAHRIYYYRHYINNVLKGENESFYQITCKADNS